MMRAVAIKQGQSGGAEKTFRIMGIVTCDTCGESFFIGHYVHGDPNKATSQAQWLEKVLAYDHERERKHPDKIDLP